jgi:hypothetical protein
MLCSRPSCLDRVPEWIEDYLRKCPRSPEGVHRWLASATHKTFGHLENEEQVKALRWAMRDCGRDPQPREIENTVSNIRARRLQGEASGILHPAWPPRACAEVDKLVRDGITAAELRRRSPYRIPRVSPWQWLKRLFPAGSLLCLSQEYSRGQDSHGVPVFFRRWQTKTRDGWRPYGLRNFALLVPNPAQKPYGRTLDGRRSTRCKEMFPRRCYLVIEFDFSILNRAGTGETEWAPWIRGWEEAGRSTRDACAALLWHLSQYAPLALVVWSGGKSLQGWFSAWEEPEQLLRRFMEYAHMLGADPATWAPCQLVRTPQAIRSNGNRQRVEFFDSDNLPD